MDRLTKLRSLILGHYSERLWNVEFQNPKLGFDVTFFKSFWGLNPNPEGDVISRPLNVSLAL